MHLIPLSGICGFFSLRPWPSLRANILLYQDIIFAPIKNWDGVFAKKIFLDFIAFDYLLSTLAY